MAEWIAGIVFLFLLLLGYHLRSLESARIAAQRAGYRAAQIAFAKAPGTLPRLVVYETPWGAEETLVEPWNYWSERGRLGSPQSARAALQALELRVFRHPARRWWSRPLQDGDIQHLQHEIDLLRFHVAWHDPAVRRIIPV